MKNVQAIKEMSAIIANANVANANGRNQVINTCKKFYNLIEEDAYMAGCEWMLKGMYSDLCEGNFAEPFMCEQKKSTFNTCVTIYQERILPRL
jgi:hypothetical protein